jgi:hypothetical protein
MAEDETKQSGVDLTHPSRLITSPMAECFPVMSPVKTSCVVRLGPEIFSVSPHCTHYHGPLPEWGPVGPNERILTTFGNKRLIAFYVPDSGRSSIKRDCGVRFSALPENYFTGFFRHSPKPRPNGRTMNGADRGLTFLAGRHRSPSLRNRHEVFSLLGGRSILREGIAEPRKVFQFLVGHDMHLPLQAGHGTLLDQGLGLCATRRIQSGNLRDTMPFGRPPKLVAR